ncbi:MAG: nucleotide exchange factor GrpE [Micavibrio aeruginosavorus]|nr:nucleotide exchange factor GrpE [Micavibrio aeruginosavorus]
MTSKPDHSPMPEDPATQMSPDDQFAASPEQGRIAELEAELARMKDHMLRALADAENTRKRAIKEREDAGKFAVSAFARDMLDIADNFRRALDAIPEDARKGDDPLIKTLMAGIEAIERGLLKTFEKHGIKKLEPLGSVFDPNFHEVMFEAPVPGKTQGTIIQVIEPGYTLNERLLRPARVGIAKGEPGGDSGPPPRRVDETA